MQIKTIFTGFYMKVVLAGSSNKNTLAINGSFSIGLLNHNSKNRKEMSRFTKVKHVHQGSLFRLNIYVYCYQSVSCWGFLSPICQ